MPRILPRLIEKLKQQPLSEIRYTGKSCKPPRKASLWKPVPPRPSFNPANYERSILLEPGNPITEADLYERHKSLPPVTLLPKDAGRPRGILDMPREMTEEERQWFSSPYLRMLSSPVRVCALTHRHVPSAFLIRLGKMRMPLALATTKRGMTSLLVPDSIEHPQFQPRRAGHAVYILNWKAAVQQQLDTTFFRLTPRAATHPRIIEQIDHLLRVRVLQELELLADKLDRFPWRLPPPRILRRLTRDEFNSVQESGLAPFENAIALLVVPPVNKNPETKERPEPSMSPLPPADEPPLVRKRPALPLSKLLPTSDPPVPNATPPLPLPEGKVPLYNGSTMFPVKAQRAALHSLLKRILEIEAKARQRSDAANEEDPQSGKVRHTWKRVRGDEKASHAFVLFSSKQSVQRGDTVPLAIALWRVRMFEGADWTDETGDGWLLRQRYASVDRWE